MENLDLNVIGQIAGILVAIVTILQFFKKEKSTNDNKVNQSIKGLFFSKNNISQKVEKRDDKR